MAREHRVNVLTEAQSQPAEITAREDPRRGGGFEQRFRGFGYLFQGWGFVGKHTELIKYCVLPMLLTILVFVGVFFVFWRYYSDIVSIFWAKPGGWTVMFWWVFYLLFFFAAVVIGYVLFFVVQAIVTAPFNDVLSERVEAIAYGNEPPPFSMQVMLAGVGRALLHELAKLAIYLGVMIPLLLLNFIPVIGTIAFSIGGFVLTARFLAYDHTDYCMARRQWSFARKRQALKDNRALTSGFGAGVASVLLVPVFGILSIPMAAVGGTLLFCDLESHGAYVAAVPEGAAVQEAAVQEGEGAPEPGGEGAATDPPRALPDES